MQEAATAIGPLLLYIYTLWKKIINVYCRNNLFEYRKPNIQEFIIILQQNKYIK